MNWNNWINIIWIKIIKLKRVNSLCKWDATETQLEIDFWRHLWAEYSNLPAACSSSDDCWWTDEMMNRRAICIRAAATFWLESGPCGTPRGQRLSHLQLEHSDAKDKPVKTALAPFNRTHRKISSKFHPFSANQSRILLRVSSRKSATTFWRQIPPPQSIQLNLSTFYNVLMNCKSLNIS